MSEDALRSFFADSCVGGCECVCVCVCVCVCQRERERERGLQLSSFTCLETTRALQFVFLPSAQPL